MKILLVASKFLPEYTGAAVRLHRLYRSLREQEPDVSVRVMCAGVERSDPERYEVDGVPVQRLRSRAPLAKTRAGHIAREVLDAWEARRHLRRELPDIVHTVGMSPLVSVAIHQARQRNIPLLIEMVTGGAVPDQGLPAIRRFHRPDLKRGSAIVAISEPLAEVCRARGYTRNVWVRPNPVDTTCFFPEPKKRNEYLADVTPFSPDDVVIAAVAKFMPQKNQSFLLDMLAQLPERFKLLLAGPLVSTGPLGARDQSYFSELLARRDRLGLGKRVHIVSEFVPAERYIKAADIFATPSREEGLGTPVLEAQACGLPVIANADVPAFRGSIDDGRTGYLCSLDPRAWAQAAKSALKLDQKVLNARAAEIASHYSFSGTQERYWRLLTGLAAKGAHAKIDVGELLGEPVP